MNIARSTFYDQPVRATDDTAIVEAMASICDEFEHYGWRRVQAALRQQGMVVNHKKIRRLMREHDLQPRTRRRFTTTTDSNHDQPIFPNLAREMVLDGPDQLWVADITYVRHHHRRLRICRHRPGCMVPAGRRLRHQPLDRRQADLGCPLHRHRGANAFRLRAPFR